jgi:hypothetical protein
MRFNNKKIPYFADTTERGDGGCKHAQRQGDFTNNSIVWKFMHNEH